jgi:hypothetical protein
MSDIRTQSINDPDLDDVLDELKNEIFSTLNCIQIGKIESYNKDEQTVEIQIQVKRRIGTDEIKEYPLLVDCPIFILQGGGAYLEFPITKGDYCLILFNDRDMDTWWSAANVAEPLTTRKHSLSDGFAIIGINPKTSVFSLVGDKVKLNGTGFDIEIETDENISIKSTGIDKNIDLETSKNITIKSTGTDGILTLETGSDINIKSTGSGKKINLEAGLGTCNIKTLKVNIGGDETLTEELIKATAFLTDLILAFNTHTHNFSGTGSVLTPTVPWIEAANFANSKSLNNKTS